MSFRHTLDRLIPDTTVSTKEMPMACSGCFASLSQYEMLMCKRCRRIYCRQCTGETGTSRVETQLDRCAICRKHRPHPESVLFFAVSRLATANEGFMKRVRLASRDASMDSVEDLLRRVCEESGKSYAEWQDQYERSLST